VQRLLRLPELLIRGADRDAQAATRAREVETALAIAVLSYCPVRFGNLLGIEIDRHITRHGSGRRRRTLLWFPGEEVKNHQDLGFELPQALATLIDRFIAGHRPALLVAPSRYLFSGREQDRPLDRSALSKRIGRAVRTHLGVDMSPHNFRHLAGLVYLTSHPGEFETVRRLLGHASSSTATDAYVGLEVDAAHRAYVSLLDTLREDRHG
jgi:integrase